MSKLLPLLATLASILTCALASAQPAPAAPATQPAEPLVGEMRMATFPAITYLYGSQETTLAKIKDPIEKFLGALVKGAEGGKLQMTAAPLMIFKGMQQDLTQPFTLEVGFPVREGAAGFDEFKTRKLEPFHCATVLYSGPIKGVDKAYGKLFGAIAAAGLTPTGEIREAYLYWESEDSPNNVVLVEAGVQ